MHDYKEDENEIRERSNLSAFLREPSRRASNGGLYSRRGEGQRRTIVDSKQRPSIMILINS